MSLQKDFTVSVPSTSKRLGGDYTFRVVARREEGVPGWSKAKVIPISALPCPLECTSWTERTTPEALASRIECEIRTKLN